MSKDIARKIINFGNDKYASPIGYVILIKILTIYSLHNQNKLNPLSVLCLSPSGHFKSRTSDEIIKLFPNHSVEIGDFTIFGLYKEIEQNPAYLDKKTMRIDDLTSSFSSKSERTKSRTTSGIGALLSEGLFIYKERLQLFEIRAKTNLIANMTIESFNRNKNKQFVSNTFIERLFPFFYAVSNNNQKNFDRERDKKREKDILDKFKNLKINSFKVLIPKSLQKEIESLADEYKENVSGESYNRAVDKIRIILVSLCLLNNKKKVSLKEIELCKKIISFTLEPDSTRTKVLILMKQGKSPKEISNQLDIALKNVYGYQKKIRESRRVGDIYEE